MRDHISAKRDTALIKDRICTVDFNDSSEDSRAGRVGPLQFRPNHRRSPNTRPSGEHVGGWGRWPRFAPFRTPHPRVQQISTNTNDKLLSSEALRRR